jgi:uncharacterized protein DUF6188
VELPRDGDAWALPCEGLRVSQIRIDYAFGLELAEDQKRATDEPWRFRINTRFTYRSPTWREEVLDPEGPAGALGPALSVRHQTLVRARMWPDGRLVLGFQQGDVITVAADDRYEAWEASGGPPTEPILLVSPIAPDTIE